MTQPEYSAGFPCQTPGLSRMDRVAISEAGRLACDVGALDGENPPDLGKLESAARIAGFLAGVDPGGPYAVADVYLRPPSLNPAAVICAANRAAGLCLHMCHLEPDGRR
jgi:hypothetical protein